MQQTKLKEKNTIVIILGVNTQKLNHKKNNVWLCFFNQLVYEIVESVHPNFTAISKVITNQHPK